MIFIAEPFRDLFAGIGFEAERIFNDPGIKAWRKLADRENCTWDVNWGGKTTRFHVKRFPAGEAASAAKVEARGYELLRERGIPAAIVAAWGTLDDGRSFIAMPDLEGFAPADKLIEGGLGFERVLAPTAEMSAKLHGAGLHHRDLYLCHFMARPEAGAVDLRMIDAARVRELPLLTRRRWIVKDLAQFWYSTTQLAVSDVQREAWLAEYVNRSGIGNPKGLRAAIIRKSEAIRRHDARIRTREPGRNISIPK